MENNIKTFEDACKVLGIGIEVPEVSALPEKHRNAIVAHYKLVIIAQALNEGWEPDWSNDDEYKYYPWFDMSSGSGSGFSCVDYDYSLSISSVGSRLCFKSWKLAKYAGQQFEDLYKDYFTVIA